MRKRKIMKSSNPSPMAASSLLVEKLRGAGFTLSAEGSRLRVAPADLLTDELRQSIKEHRSGIIALLAAESPQTVESHPSTSHTEKIQRTAYMAPLRAHCGVCLHFLPDTINPVQGIGRCEVTGAGPPSSGSGYKACYPLAPRKCSNYEGIES